MCRNARCSTWIKTLGTFCIKFIILKTSLSVVESPFYFLFVPKNNLLIIYPLLNCRWHSKNQSGIIQKEEANHLDRFCIYARLYFFPILKLTMMCDSIWTFSPYVVMGLRLGYRFQDSCRNTKHIDLKHLKAKWWA